MASESTATVDVTDGLAQALGDLTIAPPHEVQLAALLAMAAVEKTRSGARNFLIHAIEDKEHSFPHSIADLRRVSPALDAALQQAAEPNPVLARAMFVVRLLDYCREHYYLMAGDNQERIDQSIAVAAFLARIRLNYPSLDNQKRKNQLRNFVAYQGGARSLIGDINKAVDYAAAVRILETKFRGNRKYASGAVLHAAAVYGGKIAGLDNLGQTLHILKSSQFKTRDGDTATMVENVQRLCRAVDGVRKLVSLAQTIGQLSGGFCFLALTDEQPDAVAHACTIEDPRDHQRAVKRLVSVRRVGHVRELPDIGALLDNAEFLDSFAEQ